GRVEVVDGLMQLVQAPPGNAAIVEGGDLNRRRELGLVERLGEEPLGVFILASQKGGSSVCRLERGIPLVGKRRTCGRGPTNQDEEKQGKKPGRWRKFLRTRPGTQIPYTRRRRRHRTRTYDRAGATDHACRTRTRPTSFSYEFETMTNHVSGNRCTNRNGVPRGARDRRRKLSVRKDEAGRK